MRSTFHFYDYQQVSISFFILLRMAAVCGLLDLTLSLRLGSFILAMGIKAVLLLKAMITNETARSCLSQTFDVVFGIIIFSKILFLAIALIMILPSARRWFSRPWNFPARDFIGTIVERRSMRMGTFSRIPLFWKSF